MKSRRFWWAVFACSALLVCGGLLWMTCEMIRLERDAFAARAEDAHQDAQRLALWRMDSWLAPQLAREAARPYYEYLPYYAHERAYTRLLNAIQPGEVRTESPLLRFESELILIHFQRTADGAMTSPQAPQGNLRDLAEANDVAPERLRMKDEYLARVSELIGASSVIESAMAAAYRSYESIRDAAIIDSSPVSNAPNVQRSKGEQIEWSKAEQSKRAQTLDYGQTASMSQQQTYVSDPDLPRFDDDGGVTVGPLVPLWPDDLGPLCDPSIDDPSGCVMVLAREVRVNSMTLQQGVLFNWTALRDDLLERVADLFPSASLRVLRDQSEADEAAGMALAAIPVALETPQPDVAGPAGMTATRWTLVLVWIAMGIVLLAVGVTLHSSIAYGEKRSRFASAVTHELRTPLTTFQMYSEMLAEGMVQDEEQRKKYLCTLTNESHRLGALVENVLAYARLERGAAQIDCEPQSVGEMMKKVRESIERRAQRGGKEVRFDFDEAAEARVRVDADAVEQILVNLVDNACKYANGEGSNTIELTAHRRDGTIQVAVRDHGRGVPAEHVRSIFSPFHRGAIAPGDTTPGVGLGLALARGLARRMGGELSLDRGVRDGACFRLSLPLAE